MPPIRPRTRGFTALGLALAVLAAQPTASALAALRPGASAQQTAGTAAHRMPDSRTVTLITGDKVTVNTAADGSVTRRVQGADGRATGFRTQQDGDDTYVFPEAALPYVAAGTLDRELFDVTRLLADGYADDRSSVLPLIVTYSDAAARARTEAVPAGATKTLSLSSVQGAALSQRRTKAADFWASLTGGTTPAGGRGAVREPRLRGGIAKVWLDGKVEADLADTTEQIGAPQVWAGGDTGQGVDVAVLDTGVDTRHPDLVGQVAGSTSFVPDEDIEDHNGHGTHVASTIAGTGAASDGKERGVAPGARLHVGKVLAGDGSGQESWVLAGMEWAARDQHAKIISMSLGAGPTDGSDPLSQAVDRLSAETGALFTIAAGNDGQYAVAAPSVADAALSVGAVDGSDRLASFSATGPRQGDAGLKPELTAPGVDVLAARSRYALEGVGDYQTLSGTSMATPHVAGAAALLAAAHPDWTGQQLKDALVSSTKMTPGYTPYQGGSGRLDAAAAVHGTVFATGSAFGGYRDAAVPAGEKATKEVTYTNTGDSPVALDLSVQVPGAVPGEFALSARRVSVPAHGTGKVTLTTDFDLVKADTVTSGQIVATDASGTVRAHTLTGAYKMGPRHTLTVNGKDRDGRPLGGVVTVSGPRFSQSLLLEESGTGTVTLPPGTYAVQLETDVEGAHGPHSKGLAVLTAPEVVLDQDTTVNLDAGKAKQLSIRTPRQSTAAQSRIATYRWFDDRHAYLYQQDLDPSYDSAWVLPTDRKVTTGTFELSIASRLEQPALTVASGTRAFDDLRVHRGRLPLPSGTRKYDTVYAGEGDAAAYAGLNARGKVVVVRRSDAVERTEQAKTAARAGAELLLVVNDGYGRLDPWDWDLDNPYSPTDNSPPLTVASLTADEGDDLITQIERGHRTALEVTSHPTTDYLYDIVWNQSGIPADPTYRPQPRDLARVDVSFRNNRPAKAIETRAAVWHGDYSFPPQPTPAQAERTDWVSADTDWYEEAAVNRQLQIYPDTYRRYPAGTTSHLEYFGPVQRPRLNSQWRPVRTGDTLLGVVPGWGDSVAGHAGTTFGNADVRNKVTLYQGDTVVRASDTDTIGSTRFPLVLPPEKLRYRLVSENSRETWRNDYSTSTRTEWGFTSGRTADGTSEYPALVQLDYAVAGMDVTGKAGRHAEITVSPVHLPGGPDSGSIRKVTVNVSYDDGATWHHAVLRHTGQAWTTRLDAPRGARFVTLRTSAADTQDNTVTQSITRAFGLK
ncbi:S8 family serine peptidase [Streptomyces sp. NPDC048521]|uniref:S8 family serine peptidase n=1 Tax=Streptomyces sp. NPDC048521 TaxID=3365566 RepID=UPI0037137104